MKSGSRRSRRIFRLVLIPLLLLVVMQAALSFGTTILGGTFTSLRTYAAERLGQVTETRQIILEGQMVQQWTGIDEEYAAANQMLGAFLEEKKTGLEDFLAEEDLQKDYLTRLLPSWSYMMRKNSTTGAFLIVGRPEMEQTGGTFNGLYLRDGDPDTNPADYSDLLLTLGPSDVSQTYKIPLDIDWRSQLTLAPLGEREADQFVYAPYIAALSTPGQDARDLCYWSAPFRLEDDLDDSYRMITYSVPLIDGEGQVWGVMGIEISLPYLEENLPYQEIDSGHQGGYLLVSRTDGESYRLIYASGPTAGYMTMDVRELTPEPTGISDLLRLTVSGGQEAYLVLKPLRLYNTNTPFYDQGWYLAGLETRGALFGISDRLTELFVWATVFSLGVAICLALCLARYVTNPIRRLSACIQTSPENELNAFPPSHIAEVDELYDTIRRLTLRQKQTEYDLLEEKERYRLALQSSSDVLVSYDMVDDQAVFYNLNESGREERQDGLVELLRSRNYIHPDDRRVLFARLTETQSEISVSFRIDFSGQTGDYRWYELNGRILPAGEGRHKTLIGALHNIHDQKLQETAAYESLHRDSLTGLYRRASGEDIVRSGIQAGRRGSLLLLDIRGIGALNQQLGITAGNTVLEEMGQLLAAWQEAEAPAQSVLLRLGGNQFLLWLENCDRKTADRAARELVRRAEALYTGGSFTARLVFGCAQTSAGEDYNALLDRACIALAEAKAANTGVPVWAEDLPEDAGPAGEPIVPIDYTVPSQGIVPLTFALFDRGGEVGDVLSILFPRLGQKLGVCDIVLSQVNPEFFTSAAVYQWHGAGGGAEDTEVAHFTAAGFTALLTDLWEDGPAFRDVQLLTDEQRRFLRAPRDREGLAYPLYDSGTYMGALLFLRKPGSEPWSEDQEGEIHEAVKVIEANMNRQRYDAASRAKSDFLSRMSHEIRTPMNAIIGMTYIAKTHTGDQRAVAADLDKIDQSSHYLLGLINDILDMSRIESGKMTIERSPFDLRRLLDGVGDLIRPQAEAKNIRYRLQTQIGQPWVEGDELRLNQVLINLLGNAVKFTPAEGAITLTVRQAPEGEVYFSVKDSGIGVSPENQERIFQSFEQADKSTVRQYGGTGLGLAISSRLVRMMGGVIQLDSAPGQGSDFYFTVSLPVSQPPETAQAADDSDPDQNIAEGLRILLVEDNELNIEIAQTILEMHGALVTLARDGREAVERFTASRPGDFDLILMDIQMPVMDGLEAAKVIRRSGHPMAAAIPIVAMTANAFDEDMKRSVDSGMNGHLSKPLDIDQVFRVIRQVVHRD